MGFSTCLGRYTPPGLPIIDPDLQQLLSGAEVTRKPAETRVKSGAEVSFDPTTIPPISLIYIHLFFWAGSLCPKESNPRSQT